MDARSNTAVQDRKSAMRAAVLSAPILPTMMKLAIPTIAVLVAQILVSVAETYYVGFLGTTALVGVALVFPVLSLMTMTSVAGIGGGVASSVARAVGAGRHEEADALVLHAVVLAVGFGLTFTVVMLGLGPMLYRSLGGQGAALDAALLYSGFVFAAAVPIWVANMLSAALRGAGDVRTPALVTLLGAGLLIPISPALIFGFGPIPRFGIAGAGLAVATYFTLAAAILLRNVLTGASGLTLAWRPLEKQLFGKILSVGIISSIGTIQLNLIVILVTGAVGLFGTGALAGYGVASRLDYLLSPLLFGLGAAVLTMVGANVGAGNIPRARRIAWTGALIGFCVAEAIGLFTAAFPSLWVHLFSRDPAVTQAGALYLRIVGPVYGALGVGLVLNLASQGAGRPIWPILGGTVRLTVAAGLGWLVVARLGAGLPVLFAIVAAASVIAASISAWATWSGAVFKPRKA